MNPLARWMALTAAQRRLLVEAAVELPLTMLAVRLVSFARLTASLGPLQQPASAGQVAAGQGAQAGQIAWAIGAVARRLPADPTCLARALAAQRLCASRGIATRLHLGAQRGQQGRAETHAWLDAGDTPITGYPLPDGMVEVGFFG